MKRILLTKLLQHLPGREFDGSGNAMPVFSQRLANNFDGDEGTMFSRQSLGNGTLADGQTRWGVLLGDDSDLVAIGKRVSIDTVIVERTGNGVVDVLEVAHTDENEYYAQGLAWSLSDGELVHVHPDGSEQIVSPGASFVGALTAAYIGGETANANVWRGFVSHVVVFFEYLSESQRKAMYNIFSSGSIAAEYINISVSRKFVLWTIYPHSQIEQWGSNTIL